MMRIGLVAMLAALCGCTRDIALTSPGGEPFLAGRIEYGAAPPHRIVLEGPGGRYEGQWSTRVSTRDADFRRDRLVGRGFRARPGEGEVRSGIIDAGAADGSRLHCEIVLEGSSGSALCDDGRRAGSFLLRLGGG